MEPFAIYGARQLLGADAKQSHRDVYAAIRDALHCKLFAFVSHRRHSCGPILDMLLAGVDQSSRAQFSAELEREFDHLVSQYFNAHWDKQNDLVGVALAQIYEAKAKGSSDSSGGSSGSGSGGGSEAKGARAKSLWRTLRLEIWKQAVFRVLAAQRKFRGIARVCVALRCHVHPAVHRACLVCLTFVPRFSSQACVLVLSCVFAMQRCSRGSGASRRCSRCWKRPLRLTALAAAMVAAVRLSTWN